MALKTNYKDDVYTGKRKFRQTFNPDNTLSLDDVTEYEQAGDAFGALDINATNAEVNRLGNSVIVTLPAAGWSGTAPYTQRVAVAGVKETDKVYVHPYTPKGIGAAALKLRRKLVNMMNDVDSENGALLFSCEEKKPTADFPVLVEGVSANG